jgi:hypothetical protein
MSTGADEVVRSGHLSTEERKAASHPKSLEADGRRPSLTLGGRCSEAAALPAVGRERSARWRQVHHPRGCAHGPLHLALSRAALRRRGWGHTASVCTCAMYLASSYAPQARGGQAVSSAVTAQSCLALRGRLPTDGLGPPRTKRKDKQEGVGGRVSTGADEVVRSGHLSTEERKAASHPKSLEADGRRPSLTLGGRCSEAAALPAVGRERSARWRQVHHPRGCAHGPLHLALSRAALRRRGWGHTASVCTCAMYLASSYAPQARGGQAVSSAVTAQSCLALRGRLPTDGLGPPKTQVCVAREARAARAKQPKCGCLTRADGACRPQSRAAGASGKLGPPAGTRNSVWPRRRCLRSSRAASAPWKAGTRNSV